MKDGYLIIDERDLAKIRQKTRSGFFCAGLDRWQKSVGNQRGFVNLDGRQAAASGRIEDLAKRRENELLLKFNLPFNLVNRNISASDPNVFRSSNKIVTSIDFISREDVLNVAGNSHWDLLVP